MNKQTLCLVGTAVGSYFTLKHAYTRYLSQKQYVMAQDQPLLINQRLFNIGGKYRITHNVAFCEAVTNPNNGSEMLGVSSSNGASSDVCNEEGDAQPTKKRVGFKASFCFILLN